MLQRLLISNYALIDHLEIDFSRGLTIVTGETGAGKSIILGALGLILGERADTSAMRDKDKKTIVEATINTERFDLTSFYRDNDLDEDGGEMVIRREIAPSGRSRALVNDSVVPLSALRDLMTCLVDIHSQHSNMLLAQPSFQLSVLDNIAGNAALLAEYATLFNNYRKANQALKAAQEKAAQAHAQEDYLRFQLNQLTEAKLEPEEDKELEAEQKVLANAASIRETLWDVGNSLDSEEDSTLQRLLRVAQQLEQLDGIISDVDGMGARVRTALIELQDIAQSVESISSNIEDNPQRLEYIEDRLNTIFSLERKHNVTSLDELLALQHQLKEQIDEIDNSDEYIVQLTRQRDILYQQVLKLAKTLSEARRTAAKSFVEQVMPLAQELGMKNLAFEIEFSETSPATTGTDAVEFKFAFNKNQKLMPVKDTASGGEISRLMLCVKAVIARSVDLPTLIFDEIDTGVSGEMASKIGALMHDMSQRLQVIAITHLPQVASYADAHLLVTKSDTESSTLTTLMPLDEHQHVQEIARMLSGGTISQAAIENARQLINNKC
ncbi:MAG: DNA repair protein RecN [Muribaculaceae bacterium]|nr:DNA repair protein RecN [Muribaculaceae bacterium]